MDIKYEFLFDNCPECPLCMLKVRREPGVIHIRCKFQDVCLDKRSNFYKKNRLGQKKVKYPKKE